MIKEFLKDPSGNFSHSRLIAVLVGFSATIFMWIKVWMGFSFIKKPLKVWNGTNWVQKPLKVWSGTEWEIKG